MSELKPCPFCGSDEVSLHHDDDQDAYWIACVCNATMVAQENDHDKHVIAAWNRRTQPEATKPAQDLGAATQKVLDWIGNVCNQVRYDIGERKRTGEDEKFYTFTLNEMTHLLPILSQALASPADALVAGDRVDAKDAALEQAREALHVMLAQFTKTPSTLHDTEARCAAHEAISTINAAIQAQKDGHG